MNYITDHILQFEEHRYGSTFYNLLQSAKNDNFPYIPIVNVPVFLDDPKKEPNSRFFLEIPHIYWSWCELHIVKNKVFLL